MDIETWKSVGIIAGALVGIAAVIGVVWRFGAFVWGLGKNAATFFDDWNGSPARPGKAEVLGVMARLDAQDAQSSETTARLKRVEWHSGNGNPVPLREVVEGHTKAIYDILAIIGARSSDTKRDPQPAVKPRPKGTVEG